MQISCERCNTVYVLDDKLIPPSGAPVQCTRCGLVFTAKPPKGAAAVIATPPPKPAAPPSARQSIPSSASFDAGSDRRPTQMFGGATAPAVNDPAAKSPQATMMFGGSSTVQPKPAAVSKSPDAAANRMTQMFGSSPAAGAPAPSPAGTMMFGSAQVPTTKSANSTMMFGAAGPILPEKPAAFTPSQVPDLSPGPVGTSTMMFGAAQPIQQPEGDRAPAVEMPAVPNTGSRGGRRPVQDESSTDPDLTMLPPSGAAAPAPSWMSAAPEEPASPATNTAPVQRRAPPGRQRPLPTPAPLPIPSPEQMEAVSPVGAQTMELQLSLKKRQRLLPIIVGVLVGAALVAGGIYFYLKTRTPPADPALVAEDGRALDLLRQDDEDSIKKAVDIWQSLQVRSPDFVPPRANELIAHVFLNQNLHDDAGRLTRQAEQAQRDMVRVTEKKVGANWVDKANALRDEIIKIKEQVEPLQEAATKHDERANELLKSCAVLMGRLGPAADSSAVFRASALYYSVKGHDGTEKLAATYQKGADERGVLHDDARAFADLAMAGRYAQPRITPGDRDKGVAAAQAALQKDPKLLRAHYYLAKIYLANKEYDLASTEAEALLAANPAHKAAAALKAEIAQAQAAAPKPEKPSEPK